MNKLKRVVIKEELVAITGDFVLAIILNQFLYWSDRVRDFDKLLLEEKERAEKDGEKVNIEPANGWIYKKAEELIDETMLGMTRQSMRNNISRLITQGYVLERSNPKYKWDKTKQYRINFQKIKDDLNKKGYTLDGYKITNCLGNECQQSPPIPNVKNLTFEGKNSNIRMSKNFPSNEKILTNIPEITTEITNEYSIEYSNNARAREEKTEVKIQFQKAVDYVNSKISDETIREKIFTLFENRFKRGKIPTIEVAKQMISQLEEFSGGDYNIKIELLDRSISKGYYSIFRLPEKKQTQVKSNTSYDINQYEKFDQAREIAYAMSRMPECADMSSDIDTDSDSDSDSETNKYNFHSEEDVYKVYPKLKPKQRKEPKEINNNANNESSNESQRATNIPLIDFNG